MPRGTGEITTAVLQARAPAARGTVVLYNIISPRVRDLRAVKGVSLEGGSVIRVSLGPA